MRIRIADIPPEGLKVNDTISLENLNARMSEGRDNDIEFIQAPQVEITVTRECADAEVKGSVQSKYTQPCPRCLAPLEQELTAIISLILKRRPTRASKKKKEPEEVCADDIGLMYFEADQIELESALQEALILQLHPFGIDHEGCSGVMPLAEERAVEPKTNILLSKLRDAGIE